MPVSTPARTTLALIPYLNCEPFYDGIAELGFGLVHEPPRVLGKLASEGEAACGPMAVADWFQLRDRFDPLDDFGIACDGAVHSVLAFSRRPLDELHGGRVGLTSESSTSVRLLRALVEARHSCEDVRWHRGEDEADDARLLIGDAALIAARRGLPGYPIVTDLGAAWKEWSGLPFTYARWIVSKDVSAEDRARISSSIGASLATWRSRVAEIAGRRGAALGMSEMEIANYLSGFRYRIGTREAAGERRFEEIAAAFGETE